MRYLIEYTHSTPVEPYESITVYEGHPIVKCHDYKTRRGAHGNDPLVGLRHSRFKYRLMYSNAPDSDFGITPSPGQLFYAVRNLRTSHELTRHYKNWDEFVGERVELFL